MTTNKFSRIDFHRGSLITTLASRPVRCTVSDSIVGRGIVDSYDLATKQRNGHIYIVPLYNMRLVGHDDTGAIVYEDFKVIRFGVGHDGNGPDYITGKPEHGVHSLTWGDKYMGRKGCWKLSGYKQVLIHDGADYPLRQAYGAVGCIEITGIDKWEVFNQRVMEWSNCTDFRRLGLDGKFKCELLYAKPPRIHRYR